MMGFAVDDDPGSSPPREAPVTPDETSRVLATGEGDTTFWLQDTTGSEGTQGEATGTSEAGAGSTSVGQPEFQAPAVGRRVGRYILVSRLGKGRQSVVWRAAEVEPQIRVVALKIYTPEWTLDRLKRVAHLRNEAAHGGRLADSAILPVLDFGVVAGHVFDVMPLIDGLALSRALSRRRDFLACPEPNPLRRLSFLPEAEYLRAAVKILGRVARGLGEFHAAGFVHRDIKPENILLDWADRPFLSDYGLARALDETSGERPGEVVGTPLYMPREKLLARGDHDERRCDVYAMGVTLYEAMTLARPFRIPKGMPRSGWAQFLATAHPPRPRARQPLLPAALEEIIVKAMDRNPDRRHPSAAELADDLDTFLADEPAADLPAPA